MAEFASMIDEILPDMVELRHALHAQPELCYEEHETARRIVEQLETIEGLEIRTGMAKTGVMAVLNGGKPGRCVALRADMDALAIQETTGRPYASRAAGKMHACGHDGHMACLVGAAKVLARCADELPGKVKFIFQPAEEGGGGGEVLVREGVLDDPKVDAIFALHGWPYLDLGCVEVGRGPTMASSDVWSLTIRGVGSHAAYPHKSVDPIMIGSYLVQALQTIVSRNADPVDPVVVTVGRFQAGSAANIIPGEARLAGTIRTLSPGVRAMALARFDELVKQTAAAFGASAEVSFSTKYPVTVNDDAAAAFVADVAREVLGAEHVSTACPPCMAGEDFAFYAERVPGAFWRLGVRQGSEADEPHLHQPDYDFPDAALGIGIRMHCEIARGFFRSE